MLFSYLWLAELVDLDGIPASDASAALTARGLTVDAVADAPGDTVLDLDVPANRPDCLGHLGVARELAAAFGRPLLPRAPAPPESGAPAPSAVRVRVEDPDLCPRYTARLVRGVRVGPSPARVAARLEACGLRPINNVVDASNLVLLETGHPIHTFDLARIGGATIGVRRAVDGEVLVTLDGVERRLDPSMLVIADASSAVALAGVLGGAGSEIRESTRDVLIEAAVFEPRSVRRTARRLGIATDASHRFERGVDPEGVLRAQDLAVRLLAEIARGTPAPGIVDAHPSPRAPRRLTLRPGRVRRLLGYDPGRPAIREALDRLGLACSEGAEGNLEVVAPTFRVDLGREADLVEEVARHLGYDRIPSGSGPAVAVRAIDPVSSAEESASASLAHLGFHEASCYSMIAAGEDDPFVPPGTPAQVAITNPIAEPLARLRRSLLPGLLRAADLNLRRGAADVRLFEVGRVFLGRPGGAAPLEPTRVGLAWAGAAEPRHWGSRTRTVGVHDLAGIVEYVLFGLRPGAPLSKRDAGVAGLHPGRSALWCDASGASVALAGEVHPDLALRLDLPAPVFLAEIDLDALLRVAEAPVRHASLPRVPAVSRDLSFVLAPGTSFARLLEALEGVSSPAPARFEATDRYEGKPLAEGESSLTVRVILQPSEKTLTDPEVETYRSTLIRVVEEKVGAKIRS